MTGIVRKATGVVLAALMGAALLAVASCDANRPATPPPTSLGQRTDEDVELQTAASLTDEFVGKTVAVQGEIVQQCPSVGCWFRIKDETGEVFVDLNPAGLRLKEKRVGQSARVTGRVAKIGKQFRLEAEFVEFEPTPNEPQPE